MRFLFKWQSRNFYAPRWMAFAYYSARRNECLFVAYPLNFLVALAWWIQDRWARHTGNPSWIEREVERRMNGRRFDHAGFVRMAPEKLVKVRVKK